MRILKILLTLLVLQSCNGQDSNAIITYPKEKIMNTERFDVSNFTKYQLDIQYQEELQSKQQGQRSYLDPSQRITKKNGYTITEYSIISSENGTEYAIDLLPPAPALFYRVKNFNNNGIIKEEVDQVFLGNLDFDYGIYKYYDKQGYLIKEVNYHTQFMNVKIKVDDLLMILSNKNFSVGTISKSVEEKLRNKWFDEKENINSELILQKITKIFEETKEERGDFEKKFLNPYNREDVERIRIDFDSSNKKWIIIKDFSVLGKVYLILNADSGEIIENKFEI